MALMKLGALIPDLDRDGSGGGRGSQRPQRTRPNLNDGDTQGPYQSSQQQEIGENFCFLPCISFFIKTFLRFKKKQKILTLK